MSVLITPTVAAKTKDRKYINNCHLAQQKIFLTYFDLTQDLTYKQTRQDLEARELIVERKQMSVIHVISEMVFPKSSLEVAGRNLQDR